ncbi:Repeat domain-containing protein [Chryseolinea serpens]|uniref:Repeat domain-containing protein n=1 Tax=Chryseolinea serpens TaxID=947013 RepID=A0A1M5U2X9_9BACT|nr:VCBS repeat-containing protein [Chryseolinea serpens]SHH57023.1 Repeat domain-containing protein [Chryseolinea serpens]
MKLWNAIIFLSGLLSIGMFQRCAPERKEPTLFERVDSSATHIGFVNVVPEQLGKLSVVEYLYYYNGGGVATGDINNDGLVDVFLVSNHGANKLYLNKGNFKFEDISHDAGIEGFSEWKTGVTLADVNGDGWLDIYVCALGNFNGLEGSNELYINNHDKSFTEQADRYGLDFSGMATQSAFFDYDHDGDLDLYLLTHAKHVARSYDRAMGQTLTDHAAVDHLFRNDNDTFKDVSVDAGIDTASLSYGLGLSIGDLNNDGWEDLYVGNDFYEGDEVYINQQNGTFKEQGKNFFDYFSRYTRGSDIADINNDGFDDVMTLDIRADGDALEKVTITEDPWELFSYKKSYHYSPQFSHNALQINNAGKNFSEQSISAGVYATGWSWSTLLADFNNDGQKDIFVTAGIPKALNDLDYLDFAHKDSLRYAVDLSDVHRKKAFDMMPDGRATSRIFENIDGTHFQDRSQPWGTDLPGYASGAVYADLDNDGDLDVITNTINGPAAVYKNHTRENGNSNYLTVRLAGEGKNTAGIGAVVHLFVKGTQQKLQVMPTRGFLSAVSTDLFFGLKDRATVDSLIVQWPSGKTQKLEGLKSNTTLVIDEKTASLKKPLLPRVTERGLFEEGPTQPYRHKENEYFDFYREPLIPFLVSREGPALAVGDVNGDGREDYYVGGAKHQVGALFLQQGDGSFQPHRQPAFDKDAVFEDVDATFVDVDNDKDLDLYVVSGGNEFYGTMENQQDRLYRNDGQGNFSRDEAALPKLLQNKSCVRPCDIDKDGDIDLFVGGRIVPFQYGTPASSFMLINDGHGKFTDQSIHYPGMGALGMITDAQWLDIDKDNDADLIVAGDWMPVRLFINENGTLKESSLLDDTSPIKNLNGFWKGLAAGDFDNDGDVDFAAGNLGFNSVLYAGYKTLWLFQTDIQLPGKRSLSITARETFDGKVYPLAQWSEMMSVMPDNFKEIFPTHKSYSKITMEDLSKQIGFSYPAKASVDQFASLYFENRNGKFIAKALPDAAQRTKIFSIVAKDLNGDGHEDLLLAGNTTAASPLQGAYLAGRGTVLLGDGKGSFLAATANATGLTDRKEVRNIKPILLGNGRRGFLFAHNNDSLQLRILAK